MHTKKLNLNATVLLATALAGGCGGGGGGTPSPPPATVSIEILDASVAEGDQGAVQLAFSVRLSAAAGTEVRVDYALAAGSATAGVDFEATGGTLSIAAGNTAGTISVAVNGDTEFEGDETLTITLSNPTSNATLGRGQATGTIVDDDEPPPPPAVANGLNDTGVTGCSTATADEQACASATAGTEGFPRQDAEFGRDRTDDDDSDGRAGFAFVKLDAAGVPLADQSAAFAATPWSCVEDQVTGLTWEVALSATGTYTWRNTTGIDDGGDPGVANGGDCGAAGGCDTEARAEAANLAALCGFTDWRLPRRGELLSLADLGAGAPPFIDSDWFPDAIVGAYWTATPDAAGDVVTVDFSSGEVSAAARATAQPVRLVRGNRQ